jgi:hypothetical protein
VPTSNTPGLPPAARLLRWSRLVAPITTLVVCWLVMRRVPAARLADALRGADYRVFLLIMISNTVFYFAWDTLVLARVVRWFHGPVPYHELLPVRAVSYVAGLFNTNLGRGAMAIYLSRRTGAGFLPVAGTVLFLLLSEYLHLVSWATGAIITVMRDVAPALLWTPAAVASAWLSVILITRRPVIAQLAGKSGPWSLLRTFSLAPPARYLEVVLLRAPAFLVSVAAHHYAARAFDLHLPWAHLFAFLPVIFMIAALPVTVAHLGTTQAAWIFFFGADAPAASLLAFSLAAHATFSFTRALLGLAFVPKAYHELSASLAWRDGRAVGPA